MSRRASSWIVIAATLLVAPVAHAADRVIDFDELADGVNVKEQYATPVENGIRFVGVPGFDFDFMHVDRPPAAQTGSPPSVLHGGGYDNEFCGVGNIGAKLTYNRDRVSLKLGSTAAQQVKAHAVAVNGSILQTKAVSIAASLAMKPVTLTDPAGRIAYVEVEGTQASGCPYVRADDIAFEDLAGQPLPPADMALGSGYASTSLGLLKGKSREFRVGITRANNSAGNSTFSVSGLSPGVTAHFPDGATTAADSIRIRLDAAPGAATAAADPFTVTATPASAAVASGPRSLGFTLDVHDQYDLNVAAIEVTQGIQREFLPCDTADECKIFPSLRGFGSPFGNTETYQGVRLVEGKRTAARIFSDVRTGPAVKGVGLRLRGFRGKKALGDLYGSPRTIEPGDGDVTYVERSDPAKSWNLELPLAWTYGDVRLVAELLPPAGYYGGPAECDVPNCSYNNRGELTGVKFIDTGRLTMRMFRMFQPGENVSAFGTGGPQVLPRPDQVFDTTQQFLPLGEGDLNYPGGNYAFSLDASGFFGSDTGENRSTALALVAVLRPSFCGKACDIATTVFAPMVSSGVSTSPLASHPKEGFRFVGGILFPALSKPIFPLLTALPRLATRYRSGNSAVRYTETHELQHLLGRYHADTACGGDSARQAPPDPKGQHGEDLIGDGRGTLDGVGFDIAGTTISGGMSPVAATDLGGVGPGQAANYVDLMSYCGNDRWQTVRGWEVMIELMKSISLFHHGKAVGSAASAPDPFPRTSARASQSGALEVVASTTGTTSRINVVRPVRRERPHAGARSALLLIGKNAAGVTTAIRPVGIETSQDEDITLYNATIPAAGVRTLELYTVTGQLLARRAASPSAPRVRVTAPRARSRHGGSRRVVVGLRASDRDGGRLLASVDYSRNDGRSWKQVHLGPAKRRIALPGTLFAGSRRARIRVRVNDGFNETGARSKRFVMRPRPPEVTLRAPSRNARVAADQTVVLSASAFDQLLRPIRRRKSFRWYEGRRLIARGANAAVSGLRPGRRRITVIARDSGGRTARRRVVVRVRAVSPRLIGLRVPKSLSRRSRALRLRVRSSVPARLRVSGKGIRARRFSVTRRSRAIRVRVSRGRARLRVRLALRAAGRKAPAVVVRVPRR